MNVVEIEGVTKTFGPTRAVDALDLAVPKGTIYGFIGPNGSGKTTTLRMIMRILYPDSGKVRVLGSESHDAVDDRVGYLPEERGLYKKMTVESVLRFFSELKGARDHAAESRRWLERLGLAEWGNRKVEALSKGMAQKVQFIAAVIARPEFLVLDEPFSGLDPVNAEVLKDAVLQLKKEGTTIIFSTHDMDVAEKMCDFLFMIFKGKKVLNGRLEEIKDTYGSDVVRVKLDPRGEAALASDLAQAPGVEKVNDYGKLHELRLKPGSDTQAVLHFLMDRGTVRHFELARPSLHDIFVRIAGGEAREGVAGHA